MTTTQGKSAQRELVHQLIDWELIESRSERYPAIGRTFPIETMKKRSDSPPYFCHFLSWRLGTWFDECTFQRLEELLCCSERLPNWENEKKPWSSSAEFADYWSFVWQLQVAEHLCSVGTNVKWVKANNKGTGPDLSLDVQDDRWFVECYAPRKSFGLFLFPSKSSWRNTTLL